MFNGIRNIETTRSKIRCYRREWRVNLSGSWTKHKNIRTRIRIKSAGGQVLNNLYAKYFYRWLEKWVRKRKELAESTIIS